MSRPLVRQTLRSYSYLPRAHSLKSPKERPTSSTPEPDIATYHSFLTSFTGLPRFPDSVATQIFTHKSHNHAASPYNEALSFLGRRVLYLRLSEYLLHKPTTSPTSIDGLNLDHITTFDLERALSLTKIGDVAMKEDGLVGLLKWIPKDAGDVESSGIRKVAAEAIMALVGAVEIQFGAREAKRVVEEKVIPGLRVFE